MSGALALNPGGMGNQMLRQQHPPQNPHRDFTKSLHNFAPSRRLHADEHGVGEPTMRAERVPQTSGEVGERVPSKEEAREQIKAALMRALPQYRITAKEIADAVGAQDATVEGWRTKTGVMSAEYLLMLGAAFPEFWVHVRAVVEGPLDVDAEIILQQLRTQIARGAR